MGNIYLLACHFSLTVCMNTNMNKTEILDKVVLFSGLLVLDNYYLKEVEDSWKYG